MPAPPTCQTPADKRPKHVAIIMDGNGRWAQAQGLPRIEGHRRGVTSVRRTTEECARLDIEQLTLYCLSSENWKRPPDELNFLMHLLEQYMIEERRTIMQQNIRVAIIGRREGIAADALREIDKTVELSSQNTGTTLCLAINYGARGEITDAVKTIAGKVAAGELAVDDISEATIGSHLYTADMPDPDLLIRTASEMRISNYLLWQISYSELFVTDKCWPDFGEEQLHEAFAAYANRNRKYGGLV